MKNEVRNIISNWIYIIHKNGNKNTSYRKLVTSLYNVYPNQDCSLLMENHYKKVSPH